jgi:hypothetical protein
MLLLMIPGVIHADIPSMEYCTISTRASQNVSVMICPACDGSDFSSAQTFGGGSMDATIEVFIRDTLQQPIVDVDKYAIWIDGQDLCWSNPDGNIGLCL